MALRSPGPLRVAMVFDGNELYGLPQAVANLLRSVDRARVHLSGVFLGRGCGYDMLAPLFDDVACMNTGPVFPLRRAGGPKYDPLFLAGRGYSVVRSALALGRYFGQTPAQLLHFHTPQLGRFACWATRRLAMARIWHCHGAFPGLGRREPRFVRWVVRYIHRIAAISQFVKDTFPPALRPRVRVQHNCVPVEQLRAAGLPGAFRAMHGLSPTQPLIGIFGSVVPIKGHRYFVEAAALAARRFPAARFAVVGGTTSAYEKMGALRELHQQIAAAGVADRFIDAGYLPDATRYMPDFDIVVMPSIFTEHQKGEGFGMVMIEAMAQGVAVISTQCGAPPEVIDHGTSGLLVPPKDGAALGDAIIRLLGDDDLRRRLADAGLQRVRSDFDSTVAAARLVALYEEAIAAAATPA